MDTTTGTIVNFVQSSHASSVSNEATAHIVRLFVDSVGCAAGGSSAISVGKLTAAFGGLQSDLSASLIGHDDKLSVYAAAMINASMIRVHDFNDTYARVLSGHPSDMFAAMYALTEALGRSGADFVRASAIAYEVFGAFSDVAPVRDRGWDQGILCSVGVAAGGSFLLHLTAEQTANAISLAMTPSLPMRVVRTGQLSEWKGCAAGFASMTALMALTMAAADVTGPPDPFEGVDALWQLATGPFELRIPGNAERSAAADTMIKHFPADTQSQVPIELALSIRDRVRHDEIERIVVETHHLAWHECGGGQGDRAEKWNPTTRETADHSLPYIIAVALVDGVVTQRSFEETRLQDPQLHALMGRIEVSEDRTLTQRSKDDGALPARLRITSRSGSEFVIEQDHFLGTPARPMSNDDVDAKVRPMLEAVLDRASTANLLDLMWQVDDLPSLDSISAYLRSFDTTPNSKVGA